MRRYRHTRSVHTELLEVRALLATITVTSLEDNLTIDGEVSLREAIKAANTDTSVDGSIAGDGADNITFAPNVRGAILLRPDSPLRLTSELTVDGPAAEALAIIIGTSPIEIATTRPTTLRGISIRAGEADFGSIHVNRGHATIEGVHFTDNKSPAITSSNTSERLTVLDSTFERNNDRAIWALAPELSIDGSVFRSNRATERDHAAVTVDSGVSTTISNSLFEGNSATYGGGAIQVGTQPRRRAAPTTGVTNIWNSTFIGNYGRNGGAIGSAYVEVNITDSVFVDNEARSIAGAVYTGSASTLVNSTVSGNRAHTYGGTRGFGEIRNATIANNTAETTAGGLGNNGAATIESSIIANNFVGAKVIDLARDPEAIQNSLIGSNRNSSLAASSTPDSNGNIIGTNANPIDPQLLPLASYGTDSLVQPLSSASAAVDIGSNSSQLATDQRGSDRTIGEGTDMGAFEGAVPGYITVSSPSVAEGTGSSGAGELAFEVRLIGDEAPEISFVVETHTGTADADDFVSVTQSVTLNPQFPSVTITIAVNPDQEEELNETVLLQIRDLTSDRVLLSDPGVGTIRNDDKVHGIHELGSLLRIRGSAEDDTVDLVEANGELNVTMGDFEQTFAPGFERIEVFGLGGDDTIMSTLVSSRMYVAAGAGNDTVRTGLGFDTIIGGAGDDYLRATKGDDRIEGGSGNDFLRGQFGDDTVDGGNGNDTLTGDEGVDLIFGRLGADALSGSSGRDVLDGGNGPDTINGGAGHDIIRAGSGNDSVHGGEGNDRIEGSHGDDTIRGEGGDDSISGDLGDDKIYGGSQDDYISAGDGNDTVNADSGNDKVFGGLGDDSLSGGAAHDYLFAGDGNDTVRGGIGDDHLWGSEGDDFVRGEAGNDKLSGGDGNDLLSGGSEDDSLAGGAGRDTLIGGADNDIVNGDEGPDSIVGGHGNDALAGGLGSDTVLGGAGSDLLIAGRIKGDSSRASYVLRDIGAEWASERSYRQRIVNIKQAGTKTVDLHWYARGLGNPKQNVVDDERVDSIVGGSGTDFFWVTTQTDADDVFDKTDLENRQRI